MKRQLFQLFVIMVICCIPTSARGALQLIKADDLRLFTAGGYSVIVANVLDVVKLPDVQHGTHAATLRPLATLAGSYDPTADKVLHIRFYADTWATSINEAPPVGSTVLVVIKKERDLMFAVSDLCDFMPHSSSIAVVNGLGDKQVTKTIEEIREGRTRAEVKSNPVEPKASSTVPSTQPSQGPKK